MLKKVKSFFAPGENDFRSSCTSMIFCSRALGVLALLALCDLGYFIVQAWTSGIVPEFVGARLFSVMTLAIVVYALIRVIVIQNKADIACQEIMERKS
jgi:hypothetical protein